MTKPIDSRPVYSGQVRVIRVSGLPNFRITFTFDSDTFIEKGVELDIDFPSFALKGIDVEPGQFELELIDKRELPSILNTDLGEFK